MRIASLDIEATNLSADFGGVLCACIKPLGGPVSTYRIDEYSPRKRWDDGRMVVDVVKELREYDCLLTYYGRNFDLPYLRSRLSRVDKRPHPLTLFHMDLHLTVKHQFHLSSNRLVAAQRHLGLKEQKTTLEPGLWQKAAGGDPPSLEKIVEHCVADVKTLEELYLRVLPYIKQVPKILL